MSSDHIKFLLRRADATFRAAFENNDIRIGSGDQFMLFLEVESFLEPVTASHDCTPGDHTWTRRFLCVLFDGKEPFYFRACLAKALQSLMLLTNVRSAIFANIAEIGNPIDQRITAKFRNLSLWFNLKPDLIPM
jgi:hypothetical protein